jgi:hypothetical protein
MQDHYCRRGKVGPVSERDRPGGVMAETYQDS